MIDHSSRRSTAPPCRRCVARSLDFARCERIVRPAVARVPVSSRCGTACRCARNPPRSTTIRLIRAPAFPEQALCTGRQVEGIAVPLEELDASAASSQPFARQRVVARRDPSPTHLHMRSARHCGTECTCEQLTPEAMADHRHATAIGIAEQRKLVIDPRQRVVDAHVAAQRTDARVRSAADRASGRRRYNPDQLYRPARRPASASLEVSGRDLGLVLHDRDRLHADRSGDRAGSGAEPRRQQSHRSARASPPRCRPHRGRIPSSASAGSP